MTADAVIDGLYLHVPFCLGKCDYCAFYSVPHDPAAVDRYIEAIQTEHAAALAAYPSLASVRTIYIGGGTPTVLSIRQLESLAALLSCRAALPPATVGEWTVEANPGTVDLGKLQALRRAGVNRLSLGIQFLDDTVLKSLGRLHTVADAVAAWDWAGRAGFGNRGLDLIACIPGVSLARWKRVLREAVQMEPSHVSVYALTGEEGTRLAARLRARAVRPLADSAQLAMLHAAESILGAAGYRHYEISNYAKPGFECRHNLSCWRSENYIGLGCAAASRVGARRWTNRSDLQAYLAGVAASGLPPREEEALTPRTDAAERLVFGLRVDEGVDLDGILTVTGLRNDPSAGEWRHRLAALEAAGLVRRADQRWTLTPRGRDLADHVAVELMP